MDGNNTNTLQWSTREHEHTERGADWFWALGIIAVSGAVVATLLNNILFALLIIVAAGTFALLAQRPPREVIVTLTARGIMLGSMLYPFHFLEAFWIENDSHGNPVLIVDAKKFLTPHLVIPLEGIDASAVHAFLSRHLPERELHEPIAQRIVELFGL